MTLKYPGLASELKIMLEEDQVDKKALARKVLQDASSDHSAERSEVAARTSVRSTRMLEILAEIKEPSLNNIGDDGALAISVLASHDAKILKPVLDAFNRLYRSNKANCRYQSIPAMTDAYLISLRKPQKFGTQWFFDKNNYPFLYEVSDIEKVNELRAEYGIEPLRWPKSLAIPESDQPWLLRPFSEHTMRMPTDAEFAGSLGK